MNLKNLINLIEKFTTKKLKSKDMSLKTKLIAIALLSTACIASGSQLSIIGRQSLAVGCQLSVARAETISIDNPLEYDNVNSLATQIRRYLIWIVGGIAIVFIAVAGILYIVGGATMNEGMVNTAKKGLIGAVAGLVIILGANMILNEIYYIVLDKQLDFNNLSASQILVRLINFLLAIVGTLFLISMIIGGIWYFAAGADPSKEQLGKKTIQYSLMGIIVAVAAMVILRQIDRIVTGG